MGLKKTLGALEQLARTHLRGRTRNVVRELYQRSRPDFYPYRSWSQTGEDLILRNLFQGMSTGFYVDVGAAHPRYGSNTNLLHEQGWRGINIDAAPGSMTAFRRERPRDINLEVGVAERQGTLPFHVFDDEVLNTFDSALAHQRESRHRLVRVVDVPVRRLDAVLAEHASGFHVDLLSVDCEGFDERVLRSNDWLRFRPTVVIVESLEDPRARDELSLRVFLEQLGYVLASSTPFNLLFKDVRARRSRP